MSLTYKAYLTYKEYRTGGEAIDPNDRWTSYTDENIDFTPLQIFVDREIAGIYAHGLKDEEIFGEIKSGEVAYLVVNRYSDGSTFGRCNGNWSIVGLFADVNEAKKAMKIALTDEWKGYFYKSDYFGGYNDNLEIYTMAVI